MKRLALAALVLLAAAPPAVAQEDGVFVDPDSPAGKEYAVPIDQARDEAAGGGNRPAGEEPLFGEGIKPAGGGPGNGEGGNGAGEKGQEASKRGESKRGEQGTDQQGDAGHGDPSQSSSDLGQSPAAIEAAAANGSDGLLTAGIAAVVLVVGLLGGFGLRRLLRSG